MLTKEGKQSIIIHSILFVLWIGLLILASFKDLEISLAITNKDSFVGALFAVIAEWPAYLIIPVSAAILFYNVDNMTSNKAKNITLKVVFAIVHFAGWFMMLKMGDDLGVKVPHETGFAVMFAFMLTATCLYFTKFLGKDTLRRLCKWAVFALIVLAVSRAVVTLIKLGWSRPRFRDMEDNGTLETMFTPWYHPNGFGVKVDGYKLTSFPSGHVTSATNIFVIVMLVDVLPCIKNKKLSKTILYLICSAFVVLTMFYRVVFRAHFLSDTLVAVLLSYGTFYLTKLFFFKKGYTWFEPKLESAEQLTKMIADDKEEVSVEAEETEVASE